MSTSDTPLTDGDAESTKRAYGHNGVLCTSTHARDLERQLNAARAELAEREGFYEKMWNDFVSLQRGDAKQIAIDAAKYRRLCEPQPSGEEQPNNGDVVLTHGDLSSARELGDTEKVNAGSSPAVLPLSNDEQARFEARFPNPEPWIPTNPACADWVLRREGWMACVAAHQPQGAPVAHVINTGSEWSALIQENLPDGTKLFTADQWSQSPCQHLSTSKEGASYCTLAEAQSLRLVEAEAEITRLRARQEFVFHMKTVKFFQGMIEELKAERDAAIAAHREKS